MTPRPFHAAVQRQRDSLPPVTEKEFQRQVLDLAALFGWRVYHPFLSKWSERGFPDLTLCRPPRIIYAELKRDSGRVTPDQAEWLELLGDCPGVETFLWRPADLPTIATVLR